MTKDTLPDPTNKSVIIIKGEFAGVEGHCLGPAGQTGLYAVTSNTSNRILNLRIDEEFGILINKGQRTGRN